MVTPCGTSSTAPRHSPAVRSNGPMSTRDTAATTHKTPVASSSPARSAMSCAIKRELRRRSAIEPIIRHLKADGHLGRSYLKGAPCGQRGAVTRLWAENQAPIVCVFIEPFDFSLGDSVRVCAEQITAKPHPKLGRSRRARRRGELSSYKRDRRGRACAAAPARRGRHCGRLFPASAASADRCLRGYLSEGRSAWCCRTAP